MKINIIVIFLVSLSFYQTSSLCAQEDKSKDDTLVNGKESAVNTTVVNNTIILNDISVYKADNRNEDYHAAETKSMELIHLDLKLSFDWGNEYVFGKAQLVMSPYFYPVDKVDIDALGFDILGVRLGDDVSVPEYTYNQKQITLHFEKQYKKDDTLTVIIEYVAKPSELFSKGLISDPNSRGLYFMNADCTEEGKSPQIWTHNQTEAAKCWFPVLDSPNQRMTQELIITADDDLTVISNGSYIFCNDNRNKTKTWCWRQNVSHPPYLTAIVIGKFSKVSDSLNNLAIDYYAEAKYEPYAYDIFGRTPEMISFFSDKFGMEFQWPKYSQVVVGGFRSGAMENSDCVIFGDFIAGSARELLDKSSDNAIAHELSHHWFGNLVTCESWANLVLNEAFATYSEYLWIEHKYGNTEASIRLQEMLDAYYFEAADKSVPLVRYNYQNADIDLFDNHTYSKGALVVHMLRLLVGDEAFFTSLKTYLHEYKFKAVEIHDLRLIFEKVTGKDLKWFFDQWFMTEGYPVITYTYKYEPQQKNIRINIEQKQPEKEQQLFTFPIDIEIYTTDSCFIVERIVSHKNEVIDLNIDSAPVLVWLNTDKTPLARTGITDNTTDLTVAYLRSISPLARANVLASIEKSSLSDSIKNAVFLKATQDSAHNIRVSAIDYFKGAFSTLDSALSHSLWKRLTDIVQSDKKSIVRMSALECLTNYSSDTLLSVYKMASRDSSYMVVGKALGSMMRKFPKETVPFLKTLESTNDNNILTLIGLLYTHNIVDHSSIFYKNAINKLQGNERMALIDNYSLCLEEYSDTVINNAFSFMSDYAKHSADWRIRLRAIGFLKKTLLQQKMEINNVTYYKEKVQMQESMTEQDSLKEQELAARIKEMSLTFDLYNAIIEDILTNEKDRRVLDSL